jgi:hypothetical protein
MTVMPGEIHVMVPNNDGAYICGLGAPATVVNNAGVLTNMGPLITLLTARIEDLIAQPGGPGGAGGVDEVQRFDIAGSPGSGKFTLTFNGATTDPPLAYHPPAGDVQRALEALSTVGTGNVRVSKDGNWGYVCAFGNELGSQNLPPMSADGSQLGGGGTITVSTVTPGAAPTGPVQGRSEQDGMGALLLHLSDATGAQWTYRVLPAVFLDSAHIGFIGQRVSGL